MSLSSCRNSEDLTMNRIGKNFTKIENFNISVEYLNGDLLATLFPVTFFIGLEAVFGFVGNISILCVYTRLYLHCNFRYFVLCLAIYDLTSCVATLPAEIFSEFHWYDFQSRWFCKAKSYFNVFTVWGSAFTLLLLAFDRYRKVCRPLGWQIQPSCALKLCAVGLLLSALLSIPASVFWGIQTYVYTTDHANVTVSICEKSGVYSNAIYPFVYISSVYIFPIGLMMTAICVWNILTARQMFCKMSEIRTRSSSLVENKNTLVRNVSVSSSSSLHDFIISFSHRFVSVKKFCICHSKDSDCRVRLSRRNSVTSMTSITLTEFPSQTSRGRVYITAEFQETRPTTQKVNFAHGCNGRYARQVPNTSSTSSGNDNTEVFSREIRSEGTELRRKRKTLMMLILTSVFVVTTTLYIILVSLIAERNGIFRKMSNSEKVWYFFFLRSYFINSVINPVLYGLMDPRFRTGLKRLFCSCGAKKREIKN